MNSRKPRALYLITSIMVLMALITGCATATPSETEESQLMSRFFNETNAAFKFEGIPWGASKSEAFDVLKLNESSFVDDTNGSGAIVRTVSDDLATANSQIEARYWFNDGQFISGRYSIYVETIDEYVSVCEMIRNQTDELGIISSGLFGGIGDLDQLSESNIRSMNAQQGTLVIVGNDADSADFSLALQSPNSETGEYTVHIQIDAP